MFHYAACRKVFSSADTALALGLLMCCQQAIRPVPMADYRGSARPLVATCADITCSAQCFDLAREAQADHSQWRGGLHCGMVPILTELPLSAGGLEVAAGHVGADLPPSFQPRAVPPPPESCWDRVAIGVAATTAPTMRPRPAPPRA